MSAEQARVQDGQKRMSMLSIARHGAFSSDNGHLYRHGRRQIEGLGQLLRDARESNAQTLIVSSTALRAVESAKILGDVLGAPISIEEDEMLGSEDGRPVRLGEGRFVIEQAGTRADLVVAVTHSELAQDLPHIVGREYGIMILNKHVGHGEGVLLDFGKRTAVRLEPTSH